VLLAREVAARPFIRWLAKFGMTLARLQSSWIGRTRTGSGTRGRGERGFRKLNDLDCYIRYPRLLCFMPRRIEQTGADSIIDKKSPCGCLATPDAISTCIMHVRANFVVFATRRNHRLIYYLRFLWPINDLNLAILRMSTLLSFHETEN